MSTITINPDHPFIRYTGRLDDRNPLAPVLAWQGCQVEFRIKARQLAFRAKGYWRNWLEVMVDGCHAKVEIREGEAEYAIILPSRSQSPDGSFRVTLFKRTEAYSGEYTFLGLVADDEAGLLPLEPAPGFKLEFYGDSITAGACNEDLRDDQYDDLVTHNNYLSYGAIAARQLGAGYTNCAVSGMGICESWNEYRVHDVWDKVRLADKSLTWDFRRWQPDVVVVNLGQNDDGFPSSQGRPFPRDFRERYVDFILKLHAVYPGAKIVHANGGMPASFESRGLAAALPGALEDLARQGLEPWYHVYRAFNYAHPKVAVHYRMAQELVDFLRPIIGR